MPPTVGSGDDDVGWQPLSTSDEAQELREVTGAYVRGGQQARCSDGIGTSMEVNGGSITE
jgi:hypothetical protein